MLYSPFSPLSKLYLCIPCIHYPPFTLDGFIPALLLSPSLSPAHALSVSPLPPRVVPSSVIHLFLCCSDHHFPLSELLLKPNLLHSVQLSTSRSALSVLGFHLSHFISFPTFPHHVTHNLSSQIPFRFRWSKAVRCPLEKHQ